MSRPRSKIRPRVTNCVCHESVNDTPTRNTKKGKMRSVGVQPFHSACSSGQ
jgi:hypothetical protein